MKQNTEKHWYLIVLALVIVEMVNLHIIAHFAPFWVPMILSGLVGIAMLVYAGFLYRSIRTKYRNYLERKNEELSAQISKLDFTVHDLWQYINGLHQQAEERANRQLEQLLDDSKQRAERALEMMKSNKTELTSLIQTTESALQNEGKRRLEALQRDLEALGVKLTDHHTEHREWMQGQAEAFSKEMAAHNEAITALQRAESEQAGRRTETLLKQIDTQSDANRLAISETAQMLSKAVSKTEDSLTQSGQQQMDDLTGRLEQLEQTMIQRGNAHTDLLCQEFQAFENRYMERSREESEERSQEQRELRSDLEASASHTGEQLLAVQQTLLDRMQEKEALDRETVSRQTEQWETMQDTLRLSEQENRSDTQKLLELAAQHHEKQVEKMQEYHEEQNDRLTGLQEHLDYSHAENQRCMTEELTATREHLDQRLTGLQEHLDCSHAENQRCMTEEFTATREHLDQRLTGLQEHLDYSHAENQRCMTEEFTATRERLDRVQENLGTAISQASQGMQTSLQERYEQLHGAVSEHIEKILTSETESRRLLEDVSQQQISRLEQKNEQLLNAVKETGVAADKVMTALSEQVSQNQQALQSAVGKLEQRLERLGQSGEEQTQGIQKNQDSIQRMETQVQSVQEKIQHMQDSYQKWMDSIGDQTSALQNQLMERLQQLSTDADQQGEQSKTRHRELMEQVERFSASTQQTAEALRQCLELQNSIKGVSKDTSELSGKVDNKGVSKDTSELSGKVDNLDEKLNNFRSLTTILKNRLSGQTAEPSTESAASAPPAAAESASAAPAAAEAARAEEPTDAPIPAALAKVPWWRAQKAKAKTSTAPVASTTTDAPIPAALAEVPWWRAQKAKAKTPTAPVTSTTPVDPAKSTPPAPRATPKQPAPDPNRKEEIKDPESGMRVVNQYRDHRLESSEMFRKNGSKAYEMHYNPNGSIRESKNYNERGTEITSLLYHPNGQVKTRKERIKVNGVMKNETTHFDERGQKIR